MTENLERKYKYQNLTSILSSIQSMNPSVAEWQGANFGEFEIQLPDNQNIDVELDDPSSGWVDVSLNCDQAIKIAQYFLPETGWSYGRANKPKSHFIYRVPKVGEAKRYLGTKFDGNILEYRPDKSSSIEIPVFHSSGEQIEFSVTGEVKQVTDEKLLHSCDLIAAIVELSQCTGDGKMRAISTALSGGLLSSSATIEYAKKILEALCVASNDPLLERRIEIADSTQNRMKNGRSIWGWEELTDLVGKTLAMRLRNLLLSG